MTTKRIGSEGFKWFFGTVEDRDDPLKLGRCRVRVEMIHDVENTKKISTSNLPWAVTIMPLISASYKEVGLAPVGPILGTTVFGFYMDGEESQLPVIMGTIPGIPDKKHDVKDLAREIDTLNKSFLGPEPQSAYRAKYPYNKVFASESGHIIEVDDTPNFERLHTYHRSGTYTEIDASGQQVVKIVGDGYEIVAKNKTVYVQGTVSIQVVGSTNLISGGPVNATAPSFNITGPVNVTGDVNVTGTITATGDVTGNGTSLDNHQHPDPQGGNTGTPI